MKLVLMVAAFFAVQASAGIPFVSTTKKGVKTKSNLPCTDFTGKWEGMCTFTDSERTVQNPAEFDIEMWSCD